VKTDYRLLRIVFFNARSIMLAIHFFQTFLFSLSCCCSSSSPGLCFFFEAASSARFKREESRLMPLHWVREPTSSWRQRIKSCNEVGEKVSECAGVWGGSNVLDDDFFLLLIAASCALRPRLVFPNEQVLIESDFLRAIVECGKKRNMN